MNSLTALKVQLMKNANETLTSWRLVVTQEVRYKKAPVENQCFQSWNFKLSFRNGRGNLLLAPPTVLVAKA